MAMRVLLAAFHLSLAASAGELVDLELPSWRAPLTELSRFESRPAWLGNPAAKVAVIRDGAATCLVVPEAGRGMKWSVAMPATSLVDTPWLVVRYRARNVATTGTDYALFLSDHVAGRELAPLRQRDLVSDGRWHFVAVDVSTLTSAASVDGLAIQVQATAAGDAKVWIERLALVAQPPASAEILEREPSVRRQPAWEVPLADVTWGIEPSWLANPAAIERCKATRADGSTTFEVDAAGRGMKWAWRLPAPLDLAGRRYASLRYRARHAGTVSDYAVCGLGRPGDEPGYRALIGSEEIISDGRWHTVDVDLRWLAADIPVLTGLAIQLQATAPGARLEISGLRFVNERTTAPIGDLLRSTTGADFDGCRALSLETVVNSRSASWRSFLRIADWFREPEVTVEGVPFALANRRDVDLVATPLADRAEVGIPCGLRAREAYVLLVAAMVGQEEPAYGVGRLQAIRDVDRFRLRLEYADNSADECLPLHAVSRTFGIVAGPQVLVIAVDERKVLERIVVCDRARQAAFAVAAATVRTHGRRAFPEALDERPALRLGELTAPPTTGARVSGASWIALGAGCDLRMSSRRPIVERIVHRPSGRDLLSAPSPLVRLRVDGRSIDARSLSQSDSVTTGVGQHWYDIPEAPGLKLGLEMLPHGSDGWQIEAQVRNESQREHRVELAAPLLGPYRLSDRAEDDLYLVPKNGAVLSRRDGSYRERYCGLFPLQFLDTFCPERRRGIALRTMDTSCRQKRYLLQKRDGAFTIGVEYPEVTLGPGEQLTTAPTTLRGTDGDWRRGFHDYREWLRTWYRPLSPRKAWFREVFNFRQRFLWVYDPLYDAREKRFRLGDAVDEARREFGGIDYLHIFDWGNSGALGRIYGRTGDVSPYEFLGGRDAFRDAIRRVQQQGVPVGLYIEGYLLQERGRLGQQFGAEWQLIGSHGKGLYWPDSTEMFVCPAVSAWREVQASTYATKVRELDVDGMYLDQFGFANHDKDCWSDRHGHDVPGYAVVGERDTTREVRRRIGATKSNVALYTEETPVDVTSQVQDGCFTYNMFRAQRTRTMVPLNLFRFAVPDFKTIEILFCDKPTGSWATGVKWVFFNGEAIWLEGPATEWFEPETRETIRRCYAILREHRDAFTGLNPEPLVPTEVGGVFANAFRAPGKTVYTLYNARHRTVRGALLRVAPADRYYDAWRRREAAVEPAGEERRIHLEIGPHDVGCVVVEALER